MNIQQLSSSENPLRVERLWESVRADASRSELIPAQQQELDNRLTAFEVDQDAGESWHAVKSRITSP